MDLVSLFDWEQGKNSFYRGKDCIEKFCKDLKEYSTKIINFKEKDMIPLTDEENKFYEKQEVCYICKKKWNEKNKFKLYQKVRDHCHYTGKVREAAHSICNLRYKVQNKIPVIIHNGSKYDYHFITKSLKGIFSA